MEQGRTQGTNMATESDYQHFSDHVVVLSSPYTNMLDKANPGENRVIASMRTPKFPCEKKRCFSFLVFPAGKYFINIVLDNFGSIRHCYRADQHFAKIISNREEDGSSWPEWFL